jgi:hypothetical protein
LALKVCTELSSSVRARLAFRDQPLPSKPVIPMNGDVPREQEGVSLALLLYHVAQIGNLRDCCDCSNFGKRFAKPQYMVVGSRV